jgi:hypothetical protein
MLAPSLAMTQVTVEFIGPEASLSSAVETLAAAAGAGCAHATGVNAGSSEAPAAASIRRRW